MKKYNYGGQAVIEGVMMRGRNVYTLAVRTPEEKIFTENKEIHPLSDKHKYLGFLKLPILRGMIAFVENLVVGTRIITRSAEVAGVDEDDSPEEMGKFDKFLFDKFGDKTMDIVMGFSVVLSIFLGVGLFMLLPVFISDLLRKFFNFQSTYILSLVEGIVKLVIFLTYMVLISLMKDIKRIFMYHGAEHKTINCYESGDELTVENVRKHTRLHKRCGTSFLLIVMIVSIIVFMFIQYDVLWIRMITRILLVPFVAGFSYELIRIAGNSSSKIVEIISKPGLMLQYLTTKEPDDMQIEVAIASLKGVINAESELSQKQ